MAEGKNSFILYADYLSTVEKLNDKQAGLLFKIILRYVNDKNPEISDIVVDIVFESIKQQLKRDLKVWEEKRNKRVVAAKAGGERSGALRKINASNQFYILRMFDEETKETFLKIGATSTSIGRRYSSNGKSKTTRMPYLFQVIYQYFPESGELTVSEMENLIIGSLPTYKYEPKIKFRGCLECFQFTALQLIINLIEANRTIGSNRSKSEPVTVNDIVTVNGNVNEKEILPTYSIEHCLVVAMNDDRWVRANKTSKIELEEFNKMLEKRGDYTKVPKDYKSHFANWKRAGKKDEPQIQINTNGQSHREEKAAQILRSIK